MLGVGRAIGEAMAVMTVSGNAPNMSSLLRFSKFTNKKIMSLHLSFMVQFCRIQGGYYYAY